MTILGETRSDRNQLQAIVATLTVLSGIRLSRPMQTQECRLPPICLHLDH